MAKFKVGEYKGAKIMRINPDLYITEGKYSHTRFLIWADENVIDHYAIEHEIEERNISDAEAIKICSLLIDRHIEDRKNTLNVPIGEEFRLDCKPEDPYLEALANQNPDDY